MHHAKCNYGNAAGGRNLLDHDKRERDIERSNQNIDPSRSYLNVDYSERQMSASEAWDYAVERAQEHSSRKLRDNQVVMSQDVVHLPKNWHEVYPDREPSEFFEEVALPFCRERWGGGEGHPNEISAVVHYDETRVDDGIGMPHLHYKSVPITEDGRLSHKDIYNRQALSELHPDLARFAEERGYPGLDLYDETRARTRERALDMPDYKEVQREIDASRERLESLRQSERDLERENQNLQRLYDEARERFERTSEARSQAFGKVDSLEQARDAAMERVSRLEETRESLVRGVGQLEARVERLRDAIPRGLERLADVERLRDAVADRVEALRTRIDYAKSRLVELGRGGLERGLGRLDDRDDRDDDRRFGGQSWSSGGLADRLRAANDRADAWNAARERDDDEIERGYDRTDNDDGWYR